MPRGKGAATWKRCRPQFRRRLFYDRLSQTTWAGGRAFAAGRAAGLGRGAALAGAARAGAADFFGLDTLGGARSVAPTVNGRRVAGYVDNQGICFVAGTDVLEGDGDHIDIEDVRVGQRVATDGGVSNNGTAASDQDETAVDPATWRLVTIEAEQAWADGTRDTWAVQTLQPVSWLRDYSIDPGDAVPLSAVLDLSEMGVPDGLVGRVASVGPVPEIEAGPGRVVLTTVNHLNGFVFDLALQGEDGRTETLGVTGWHKFYDEAEGWQSACELSLGDTLRGRDGQTVTVVGLARDPGVHRVYNMTVEADHVYFVSELSTLAHNNNCKVSPALPDSPYHWDKVRDRGDVWASKYRGMDSRWNTLSADHAKQVAEYLGFKRVKGSSEGMPVFQNAQGTYISPDRTGHGGGVWKAATEIKYLKNTKTRLGTYDIYLNNRYLFSASGW